MKTIISLITFLFITPGLSQSQTQTLITTIRLGRDQVGLIKATPGITTKVTFSEEVQEIICGDLFDAIGKTGIFVIQRSDNDVFLKPVATKGYSNMFVKTGEGREHTYCFELLIVSAAEAQRVVNVVDPDAANEPKSQSRKLAEDVLRNAHTQAAQIIAQANQNAATIEREALEKSQETLEQRFAQALLDLREVTIESTRVLTKKMLFIVDQRIFTFNEKSYIRYSIANAGTKAVTFSAISLEKAGTTEAEPIDVRIIQTRQTNIVNPNESVSGILVFARIDAPKARLTVYVRGENNAELARMSITAQSRLE